MSRWKLYCGDNSKLLRQFTDNSIDVCITDPPYQMNIAEWDDELPSSELWAEVHRVLKPGAWCLSFCSPELYHRMATYMEDGGFIIRDMLTWIVTTKMAKANKLKPAHEPIAVAQKPISERTIRENIERWGTGTVCIEGNRIPWDTKTPTYVSGGHQRRAFGGEVEKSKRQTTHKVNADPNGRYPSNVVGLFDLYEHQKYFFAPRVSRKDRGDDNSHPTPKPVSLMEWLVRIYTPEGKSCVLDPYCGSGSTGVAALSCGFDFHGLELSEDYCKIAEHRLTVAEHAELPTNLFDYDP